MESKRYDQRNMELMSILENIYFDLSVTSGENIRVSNYSDKIDKEELKGYCLFLVRYSTEQACGAQGALIAGNIAKEIEKTNPKNTSEHDFWKELETEGLEKEYSIRMKLANESGKPHFAGTAKNLAIQLGDKTLEFQARELENKLKKVA